MSWYGDALVCLVRRGRGEVHMKIDKREQQHILLSHERTIYIAIDKNHNDTTMQLTLVLVVHVPIDLKIALDRSISRWKGRKLQIDELTVHITGRAL